MKMNRTRWRLHRALLVALLPLLATFDLHPASTAQATQTAPATDQSDSNSAKSKKNKPGTTTDSTSTTPAPTPAPSSPASAAKPPAATTKPSTSQSAQPAAPANNASMVWVNTESGIYHKQGSRYFGKTKQGKYMTEADAIKAGYRPSEKR